MFQILSIEGRLICGTSFWTFSVFSGTVSSGFPIKNKTISDNPTQIKNTIEDKGSNEVLKRSISGYCSENVFLCEPIGICSFTSSSPWVGVLVGFEISSCFGFWTITISSKVSLPQSQ